MTHVEVMSFLEEQLKRLHEVEHVDDLMKAGRIDELKDIATKELDFSKLDEFYKDNDGLELVNGEIPEEYYYEVTFFFNQYVKEDCRVFYCFSDFGELLKQTEEPLAEHIAQIMEEENLCDVSLESLLW